jgi:hypothetical protein
MGLNCFRSTFKIENQGAGRSAKYPTLQSKGGTEGAPHTPPRNHSVRESSLGHASALASPALWDTPSTSDWSKVKPVGASGPEASG